MDAQKRGHDVNLECESVAGEEDPGASLDTSAQGGAPESAATLDARASTPLKPGDEAPAGTPGTGKGTVGLGGG